MMLFLYGFFKEFDLSQWHLLRLLVIFQNVWLLIFLKSKELFDDCLWPSVFTLLFEMLLSVPGRRSALF